MHQDKYAKVEAVVPRSMRTEGTLAAEGIAVSVRAARAVKLGNGELRR